MINYQDDDEIYQHNLDDDEDSGLQPGAKETTGETVAQLAVD